MPYSFIPVIRCTQLKREKWIKFVVVKMMLNKVGWLICWELVSRICLIDQLSFVGCISDSVMHHSYFLHDFIVFGV